ncbi:MAG: hypothetical protein A2539_06270 [Elusimicrobia bacterium RIFOXYD2_FULL_34_15]|nr:MAG: hypothetical protein A2539_06270 [Elusimicrobia bacterium RIFOXYD2_FULL_34_15]
MDTILEIKNLSVEYQVGKKIIPALKNVSVSLNRNDSLGIIGESGSGKSTLGLSILDILPKEAKISSGEILFHNQNIFRLNKKELQNLRGGKISVIFQDPLSSLNPVIKISEQLRETLKVHNEDSSDNKIKELLEMVQLGNFDRIKNSYPHQLSGGMRQRIMIAQALASRPEILIADEPTTALDVTIQKEILELLKKLIKEFDLTMIFITHNFGIVYDICSRIAVMYNGEIVEEGKTSEIMKIPKHPYTKALISVIPKAGQKVKKFNVI